MWHRLRTRLNRIPFKLTIFMVIFMWFVKEWYPFSHFPMYSSFARHTSYLYIADANNEPLPMQTLFGVRTSNLKKIYKTELKKIARSKGVSESKLADEDKFAAGVAVLTYLRRTGGSNAAAARVPTLKLYNVEIRLRDRKIEKEAEHIATL